MTSEPRRARGMSAERKRKVAATRRGPRATPDAVASKERVRQRSAAVTLADDGSGLA